MENIEIESSINLKNVVIIFLVGNVISSFFLCFFSPYFNVFMEKHNNIIGLFFLHNILNLWYGIVYTIPCFLIFIFFYYQVRNLSVYFIFIIGFIFGVISFIMVFTFKNYEPKFTNELIQLKGLVFASGFTGGVYAHFLRWYFGHGTKEKIN